MKYEYDLKGDILTIYDETKKQSYGYPIGPVVVLESKKSFLNMIIGISAIDCMSASKVFKVQKKMLLTPKEFNAKIDVGKKIIVKLNFVDKNGKTHNSKKFSEDASEVKIKKGKYELIYKTKN